MATSMNYSVVARKNCSRKIIRKVLCPGAAFGRVDFDEMCERNIGNTACTETDVPRTGGHHV